MHRNASRTFEKLVFISMVIFGALTQAAVPQVINIGNGGEPKDLDPAIVTGVPESHILMNIFEGLVEKDAKTLKPLPGVAESWKISKDGKVYTFKLRKNAVWSNGEPLTAQDFIYSWTRLLDPKTASEYSYQGYYIKNGKPFNEGKLTDASKLGLKAIDANTLEVTLENPTPFFLSLLFHQSLYPVNKAVVEKFGVRWTRPENIVTNGAFKVSRWDLNKEIIVVKNPKYWDAANVKLDEAHFYPIEALDTESKMFEVGKLHITDSVPLEKMDFWNADKTGVFHNHPFLTTYYYWFNVTKPPMNNKLVRKALSLAIDREKIAKYVLKGGQLPGQFLVPPGAGGYQPKPILPKDLSRLKEAKELLAKAGYPEGKGLPAIEILYNTQEAHKKIAETIQQMWRENLGVTATLYNQEWKVYLDSQQTKNYMVSRAGWQADYNDPNTFLDMFKSDSGTNYGGYANKDYDALIDAAARETNLKKRLEIFQKAESILLEDLPVMPIYIYTRTYLRSPKVEGWFDNIEDVHPLKFVSMK